MWIIFSSSFLVCLFVLSCFFFFLSFQAVHGILLVVAVAVVEDGVVVEDIFFSSCPTAASTNRYKDRNCSLCSFSDSSGGLGGKLTPAALLSLE